MLLLVLTLAAVMSGAQQEALGPGSCSFESSLCGFSSDPDFSSWSLRPEGRFVTVEADAAQGEVQGEVQGVLLSPVLELDEWSCLRLLYQVSGEGSLDVLQRSEGQSFDQPLWSTRSPSDTWIISSVDLSNTSTPFRLVIAGVAGGVAGSSVSLFEIHVSPGYCLDCDFERSHLCGYSNKWNANVNWFVGGGDAQLMDNDLLHDPALDNLTGHFMYVDSSLADTVQEVAELLSPMTTAVMSGCLSFRYQRSEGRGNQFSVYTRDRLGQYQELWRAPPDSRGPQGPAEWESIQVDLRAPYAVQVVFEVFFNSRRGGRVALDDISFSPEFCSEDTEPTFDPAVGSCDFEDGLCGFSQDHGATWRRISVRPNIFRSGDHTTGSGSFLVAHSPSGPRSGYVSRLVSPNLPGNTKFCLRFYFSLKGFNESEEALSVSLLQDQVQEKIWTQSEKSRGVWIQGDVSFTTSSSAQVVFLSVCRSLWDCGSVALDDISLVLGHCELSNTGLLAAATQCDFESGLCGFTQVRLGDDADWFRRRGPTPTSYTGPRGDHTSGLGYYMYLEASPLLPGQSARLRSPSLRGSGGPQCLHFHFHMYGSGSGRLSVRLDEGGLERPLWEREGEMGLGWLRAAVHYHSHHQHQIVFVATRGSSVRSDIAIDDVTLESGVCPELEELTTSSNDVD